MIIVNQDKTNIVNFDNIINIKYTDFTYIGGGHEIYCYGTKTEAIILGTYKTEERVKEVLQEIVNAIVCSRKAEEAKGVFGFPFIESNTYYQMPED